MVSRTFPTYHPKKGEPTLFVEKIIKSLVGNIKPSEYEVWDTMGLVDDLSGLIPKQHTMRRGKRWKDGDQASLRVWSGKPYRSKQIAIAGDVWIVVRNVEIDKDFNVKIDGKFWNGIAVLAANDGLTEGELRQWFCKLPFSGQLLIWTNNNLPY